MGQRLRLWRLKEKIAREQSGGQNQAADQQENSDFSDRFHKNTPVSLRGEKAKAITFIPRLCNNAGYGLMAQQQ
jgi:hypothetical protein